MLVVILQLIIGRMLMQHFLLKMTHNILKFGTPYAEHLYVLHLNSSNSF
jgi:hypothetical protein